MKLRRKIRSQQNIISLLFVGLGTVLAATACGKVAELAETANEAAEVAGEVNDIAQGGFEGVWLDATLAELGIDPNSEEGKCVKDTGLGPLRDREGVGEYAFAKCVPEIASLIAFRGDNIMSAMMLPDEITPEQDRCIMTEAIKYLAALPEDEALAAFAGPFPMEYLPEISPLAESKCGVTAAQVEASAKHRAGPNGTAAASPADPDNDVASRDDTVEKWLFSQYVTALDPPANPEEAACLEDQKKRTFAEGQGPPLYYLAQCIPHRMTDLFAFRTPYDTIGLTAEQDACIVTETVRYVATLSFAEAEVVLLSPGYPTQYVPQVTPLATQQCGVTAEQVAQLGESIEDRGAAMVDNIENAVIEGLQEHYGFAPGSEGAACIEGYRSTIFDDSDENTGGGSLYAGVQCGEPAKAAEIAFQERNTNLTSVTDEQASCILTETVKYLATLPKDEAISALSQDLFPVQYQAAITPLAEEACGVTAEQVNEVATPA